ncbi:MAG: alanyl-tRNA editing protein [Gemmatimonadaceae bacterium]|nr:alanyl-tRNA editing protein [Gemmatimonadaceae bacterium]
MTDRLYYNDAALLRFSATITALADGGRVVYLDRTAFYPTSGGQPHDLGTLADMAITDVVDEEARIAHHLAEPIGLPVGAMVVGQIDAARRYDHMQQHSGQHLLSALLHDAYGWPTVSVHFGDETSTLDVAAADIPATLLPDLERRANALVVENRPITISYEDAATAEGLRKASDRDGELRIVTIEGLDRSACGGTHVSRTAEIGALLLRRTEKTKGQMRIEFVCGHRAVARARLDAELLTRSARPLSAAPSDLPALVEAQQARVLELERERRKLLLQLAGFEADALWRAAPVDADGMRRIAVSSTGPVKDMEPLVQQLVALGACTVLVTQPGTFALLFGTAADTTVDAGQTLRAALHAHGGRGGGSPRLAQGSVPSAEALEAVRTTLGFRE